VPVVAGLARGGVTQLVISDELEEGEFDRWEQKLGVSQLYCRRITSRGVRGVFNRGDRASGIGGKRLKRTGSRVLRGKPRGVQLFCNEDDLVGRISWQEKGGEKKVRSLLEALHHVSVVKRTNIR